MFAAPALVRAQGANGVALVIGNSKYTWESSLTNVDRDAPDVVKRFQALGLKTELVQNANRDAMLAAIDKFKSAAAGANLAAFYFAGHGITWEKQSYLAPVDADLNDPKTLANLVTVPSINTAMQGARNRFLVFDACRNNPADGWKQREARTQARSDTDYLVATELATPNTVALFSTSSGSIALDGPAGGNSPFATALFRQLDAPSVDLQALPAKLRRDLLLATECRQLVSDINTYGSPFVVNGQGKPSPNAATSHDPSRIVELAQAYGYVPKHGLVLPPGLVAYRASPGTDARMVGSYRYDADTPTGTVSGAWMFVPALMIVLSVPDSTTAEVIIANKNWRDSRGSRWRYITATRTADRVSFLNQTESATDSFTWRDQHSGRFSSLGTGNQASGRGGFIRDSTFTRMDG